MPFYPQASSLLQHLMQRPLTACGEGGSLLAVIAVHWGRWWWVIGCDSLGFFRVAPLVVHCVTTFMLYLPGVIVLGIDAIKRFGLFSNMLGSFVACLLSQTNHRPQAGLSPMIFRLHP